MTSGPNPITRLQPTQALPSVGDSESTIVGPISSRRWETAARCALWLFSFPATLGALLVGGVFLAARQFDVDPDVWWHIKNGEMLLQTHRFPVTDPFSFTVAGQPWMACEWLGDVLFAFVARIGGLRGLDALLVILGSAVMVGLYVLATLRSDSSKAGLLAAAALLPISTLSFTLRPQMLGFLFLILILIALELFRRGKHAAIWFLPVLFFLWVNTHGSFPIGLGTIFVYWMSGLVGFRSGHLEARAWSRSERIQLSAVFLACLSALALTPYGTRLAAYPFEVASKLPLGVASVQEWRSMPFNEPAGKYFLVLLLGFILAQVAFDFTWRIEELALFLFGTMMACLHLRFILVFVPFFVPLLAVIFARWMRPYDKAKDQYVLNAALIALVALGLVHYFPTRTYLEQRIAGNFPVRAVEYIRQHSTPDPMFNAYDFGGYLIWSRWPEHKVFIDGRADPYERGGVLADYLYVRHTEPGTLSVLRAYGIQSCLLQRNEALAFVLAASRDWKTVYSDDLSVLFVRRGASERGADSSTSAPNGAGASSLRPLYLVRDRMDFGEQSEVSPERAVARDMAASQQSR